MQIPIVRIVFSVAFLAVLFLDTASGQRQGGFAPRMNVISSMALQPDGKILITGAFNHQPNQPLGLFRLNADGMEDKTFTQNRANLNVQTAASVALQPDGKILVGGEWQQGWQVQKLARLNADGTIDAGFSASIDAVNSGHVWTIVATGSGSIYIGGRFAQVGGLSRTSVARLNSDGSVDASFADSQADGEIYSILVQPDGKVLVGGNFNNIRDVARPGIARLNADGTMDASFVPPAMAGNSDVWTISRQADGKLIVGGDFTITDGAQTHTNLVRLDAGGGRDASFAIGSQDRQPDPIRSSLVQADGNILIGGGRIWRAPYGPNDLTAVLVNRFNPDGTRDNSLGVYPAFGEGGPIPDVYSLAVQPDGKILIAGVYNSKARALTRVNPDKTWDVPFARFDHDGDSRADLSVYRNSNNTFYMLGSQSFTTCTFGVNGDRPVPADWDGDGRTDVAVFRPSNGTWYWINSSAITFSYYQWGEPGDIPIPSTKEGRRKAMLDVYRTSNRTIYRAELTDSGPIIGTFQVGAATPPLAEDVPVIGYYTDPFQTSIMMYRPSTGAFRRYIPGSGTSFLTNWGQPGDLPVSGDYDGDGLTDIAIYRPSTGLWKIRKSADGSTLQQTWGEPGDVPVTADYDGDQRDDVAVYRPSTNTWYIIRSTDGWRIQQFGEGADLPLPAAYQYVAP